MYVYMFFFLFPSSPHSLLSLLVHLVVPCTPVHHPSLLLLVIYWGTPCGLVACCHWVTGTSAHQDGFQITHLSISHCSANMAPCSCSCFRCNAAAMESSHWRLVLSRSWSWWSTGCFIRPKSALGNWPGPTSYICLIWSFKSFSKICSQMRLELCRASFRCSHISHAMFHTFLISSKVHCQLDLWDLDCL